MKYARQSNEVQSLRKPVYFRIFHNVALGQQESFESLETNQRLAAGLSDNQSMKNGRVKKKR